MSFILDLYQTNATIIWNYTKDYLFVAVDWWIFFSTKLSIIIVKGKNLVENGTIFENKVNIMNGVLVSSHINKTCSSL